MPGRRITLIPGASPSIARRLPSAREVRRPDSATAERVAHLSRPAAAVSAAIETEVVVRLPGGDLGYLLRRSPRARRLRVTIHPERGVVVSIPSGAHRGWTHPEALVREFLSQREPWVRRHLERQLASRARLESRPALEAGRAVPYLGRPHRVRVVAVPAGGGGARASRVSRIGGDDGDELLVERVARDARPTQAILEAWFRRRARSALLAAIDRHAPAMGVTPGRITIRDTTSRWGSCSRSGALSFSWRLILAPPEALDAVAVHELCHLRVFGHGPRFQALLTSRVPDHAERRRWLRRHAPELHAALD